MMGGFGSGWPSGSGSGPTQADILIDLARTAELFHAPDRTGLADLDINGHREIWPIRSNGFKRQLARRYYERTQGAPAKAAMAAIEALARAGIDPPIKGKDAT